MDGGVQISERTLQVGESEAEAEVEEITPGEVKQKNVLADQAD